MPRMRNDVMTERVLIYDERAERYRDLLQRECPGVAFDATYSRERAMELAPHATALVIIGPLVWPELIDAAPELKWVQTLTSGTNPITSLPNLKPEVIVTSTRGIHGPQVSEMALLQMLALSRDYRRMIENQRAAHWDRWFQAVIFRKTVAIFGVGSIAEELAPRCRAFGMHVVGISDHRTDVPHFERIVRRSQAADVLAEADFVVVLLPRSPETAGCINAGVFSAMKESAFLINVSHGGVVDEAALIDALQSHRIAGASMDVFAQEPLPPASPLWSTERLVLTPHLGGMTDIYVEQAVPVVAENVRAFAAGRYEAMRNVVERSAAGVGERV